MSISRSSRLIAIVDDDESLLAALKDLIESNGLPTLCFRSAIQFLNSEARDEVACLIADIRMPGMSGLELQVNLKAEQCRIPVIFITAHDDAETRVHAVREGAVGFLSKPFDDTALLEVLHAALADRAH